MSEPTRAQQVDRLLARARFLRQLAAENLDENPDRCLTRAEEARVCADIIAGLGGEYVAPSHPDMRHVRARRKGER